MKNKIDATNGLPSKPDEVAIQKAYATTKDAAERQRLKKTLLEIRTQNRLVMVKQAFAHRSVE